MAQRRDEIHEGNQVAHPFFSSESAPSAVHQCAVLRRSRARLLKPHRRLALGGSTCCSTDCCSCSPSAVLAGPLVAAAAASVAASPSSCCFCCCCCCGRPSGEGARLLSWEGQLGRLRSTVSSSARGPAMGRFKYTANQCIQEAGAVAGHARTCTPWVAQQTNALPS